MLRLLVLMSILTFSCGLTKTKKDDRKQSSTTSQSGSGVSGGGQSGYSYTNHKGFDFNWNEKECSTCSGTNCPIYTCVDPKGSFPDVESYEKAKAAWEKQCVAKKYEIINCDCTVICSGNAKD